jgi:hypothetical protein
MTRPAHWCGSEMQTSYQRPFMACSTEVSLVALYRLPIIFWHPSQTRHKKQQEKYPRCSPIRDGISGRVSYKERVVYSVEPRHCYTSHLLFIPVTQMNSPRSMSDNPSFNRQASFYLLSALDFCVFVVLVLNIWLPRRRPAIVDAIVD